MITHPDYVPAAAVIEDADHFDAEFFGYTEEQARISDPQQRIFAECVWHALEDTGHDPSRFDGSVGVYAGCFANKYLPLNLLANARFRGSLSAFSARPYNDKDFLATRAAYLCDLRGPAMTVQSACSTSLVAIHLACQALLGHECDMALAGGVALPVPLIGGYPVVAGGIFARDGHCRPSTPPPAEPFPATASRSWHCAGSATRSPTTTTSAPSSSAARSTTTARRSSDSTRRACRHRPR
ncbi:beta-ketoacyl synthase N-terminal-like domain-containing protein [Streptomyces nogalater]